MKQYYIWAGVALLIILFVVFYFYLRTQQPQYEPQLEPTGQFGPPVENENLNVNIDVSSVNPFDKVPSINPVEKTNPFNAYQNPFE